MRTGDAAFAGSIPKLYETLLVPLIFESYARDLAGRLAGLKRGARVLEIAAGTGVVTRALCRALPEGVELVATDLNPAMLEQAKAVGAARPVQWQPADAMQLPFENDSFDAVVCQFGAMFFPDKAKAYAETRRVLRAGGAFIFNVWDRLGVNDFADEVQRAVAALFPQDPPRFLERTPYGYHDKSAIAADLARGGFASAARIDTVAARSRANDASVPAIAFCQGTPLRGEIEARDAAKLAPATDAATAAITKRFGNGAVDAGIQAHVVTAHK